MLLYRGLFCVAGRLSPMAQKVALNYQSTILNRNGEATPIADFAV